MHQMSFTKEVLHTLVFVQLKCFVLQQQQRSVALWEIATASMTLSVQ